MNFIKLIIIVFLLPTYYFNKFTFIGSYGLKGKIYYSSEGLPGIPLSGSVGEP